VSRRRRKPYAESSAGDFKFDRLGDIEIVERLGQGGRSTVYHGRWKGRDVVVKMHKTQAVERHIAKNDLELAEFEYRRNQAFYNAPGLRRYIAEPLAYVASGSLSVLIQEWLEGPLYYFYYKENEGRHSESLLAHLGKIVEGSHAAGLYDVDLHSMNVIVVEENGEPIPKLFDFNLIPFTEHPPNPFVAIGLRLGLIDPRSRDLRKYKNFHDFRRVEKKLLPFYNEKA
jgi:tRNA A-37 threonylcarbamoyl transferase component Bud32